MDDYTNYAFTCNYIPEQMLEKDDRRYFIIQDSGKNCGDHEFFQELSEEMNNHYHEFYKFLKMRDIETFVFGKAPPQTKIKTKLLSLAIDPIFKYLASRREPTAGGLLVRPSDKSPVLPFPAFFKTPWLGARSSAKRSVGRRSHSHSRHFSKKSWAQMKARLKAYLF